MENASEFSTESFIRCGRWIGWLLHIYTGSN